MANVYLPSHIFAYQSNNWDLTSCIYNSGQIATRRLLESSRYTIRSKLHSLSCNQVTTLEDNIVALAGGGENHLIKRKM